MFKLKKRFSSGKLKKKTLLVMPFYKEYRYLEMHVKALNRQTEKVDLFVVAEPESDVERAGNILKNANFPVLLVQREVNSGPAGGMFAGELFAVKNGYENIIYSDVDSLPIDDNAVEELISKLDQNTWPMLMQHAVSEDGRTIFLGPSGINHYSALKVETVKKIGFRYLPLYYVDDIEYPFRILSNGVNIKLCDSRCTHPNKPELWLERRPSPLIFYPESSLLRYNPRYYFFILATSFILRQLAFLLFAPSKFRLKALQEMKSFLHSFDPSFNGRDVLNRITWKLEKDVDDPEGERIEALVPEPKEYQKGSVPSHFLAAFKPMFKEFLGKKVVVEKYDSWIFLLMAMFLSRRAYVRLSSGGYAKIADNSIPTLFIKYLLSIPVALFLSSIGFGVSLLKLIFVKPLHTGYCLEEELSIE